MISHSKRLVFTGSFLDFFFMTLILSLLAVITFGLAAPYLIYWQAKYMIEHTEIR